MKVKKPTFGGGLLWAVPMGKTSFAFSALLFCHALCYFAALPLLNAIVLRAEHSPQAAAYTQPGIYVCQNFACQLPVFTAEEL